MILYQRKFKLGLLTGPGAKQWKELPGSMSINPEDFELLIVKINGVVYNRWSKELEKALLWEELST